MNKRDALRLKAGDLIAISLPRSKERPRYGRVVRVTEAGGILVEHQRYQTDGPMIPTGRKGWVPYHHAWRS